MTRCECGHPLQPGAVCLTCGDRCEGGIIVVSGPPLPAAELAPSRAVDLHEPDVWLGAHQEMFLAVMNKVTFGLTSQNNTLHVSGFIMEPREPMFQRTAVVKIKLNGIERARIIPLPENATMTEVLELVRAGVRDHMTEEVLRRLDFHVDAGKFRRV